MKFTLLFWEACARLQDMTKHCFLVVKSKYHEEAQHPCYTRIDLQPQFLLKEHFQLQFPIYEPYLNYHTSTLCHYLHNRTIMAENQEEMSSIEMKVARQIEVISILIFLNIISIEMPSQISLPLAFSTTLAITIYRETGFSKNNSSLMMAGWLWRPCLNSTGLLFISVS